MHPAPDLAYSSIRVGFSQTEHFTRISGCPPLPTWIVATFEETRLPSSRLPSAQAATLPPQWYRSSRFRAPAVVAALHRRSWPPAPAPCASYREPLRRDVSGLAKSILHCQIFEPQFGVSDSEIVQRRHSREKGAADLIPPLDQYIGQMRHRARIFVLTAFHQPSDFIVRECHYLLRRPVVITCSRSRRDFRGWRPGRPLKEWVHRT